MPYKITLKRANKAKQSGKSSSTQAGEFVKEQIHKIRRGVHGARSAKQAIAIGLSEARRSGVDLKPPKRGKTSQKTRRNAELAYASGYSAHRRKPSPKRSKAAIRSLKKEATSSVSHLALSRQARSAAAKRTVAERKAAARKAVRTKRRMKGVSVTKKTIRTR